MPNNFSERLKELREEKGLNQVQLAKNTGLTRSAIGLWERNLRTPGLDSVIILADYFNVSIDYLAGRVD